MELWLVFFKTFIQHYNNNQVKMLSFAARPLTPPRRKKIAGLQFSLATPEWIRAMSTVSVRHSSTTERLHNKFGVNDIVMGPCDRGSRCVECHTTMNDCVGHPGDIDLGVHIPSPFKVDVLKRVADVICLRCGTPHFPLTQKVRDELMCLKREKRLDAAKKKCPKVMFCGQLHRAHEAAAADKSNGKKKQQKPRKQSPIKTPASSGAKKTSIKRRRSTTTDDEMETDEKEKADKEDEEKVDDEEDGDEKDEDIESTSDESSASESGESGGDDDHDDDDEPDAEEKQDDGSESSAEKSDADAEGEERQEESGADSPSDLSGDESAGSDDSDVDADATASESDVDEDGTNKRKKRKTKGKKNAASMAAGSNFKVTGKVTLAAAKALADPNATAFGRRRNARSSSRAPKQFSGNFDVHTFRTRGCGAPVPRYTRDGLRLQATYILPLENSLSKKDRPLHNASRIYETLRSIPEDIQELLGFQPKKGSPMRALITRYLHVPSKIVRYKKEKENGKGGGNQDDTTQALKDVVLRSKKLQQKLKEEGIFKHDDMGSVNQSIIWYCPPRAKTCTCTTTTMEKTAMKAIANSRSSSSSSNGNSNINSNISNGYSCSCGASGQMIKCDERFCTDPDWCTCIPRSLLPPTIVLTPKLKQLYAAREAAAAAAAALQTSAGGGGGGSTMIQKRGPKGWRDLMLDLETSLTTYLIGDINKKGAGRKDGKTGGVSPWAGTTSNSNSLVKRDRAFTARFVGKHGRIRGTMYGKRCDKTARTVASGDINQNVGQVGVPHEISDILTVCDPMQLPNRAKMIDRLRSNKVDYVMMSNGDLYNTRFLNRDFYVMPFGSTCERHIENGDPAVWNRQPTLHKPSIQGAEVLLLNHPFNNKRRRTLAINQCLTTATNADFDGDELNLHLGKGQDARAETATLMSAPQQIRSQQGDSVIIVLVQNSRLALHLLTDPKTCFRRDEFQQLLFQFGLASKKNEIQRIFERCLLKTPSPKITDPTTGEQWWTGLQLVSALLPPGIYYGHPGKAAGDGELEPALIVNSEMISGRLSGKDVTHGESGNLIHRMVQDVGEEVTVAWLSGFQRVLNAFLMQFGATMSPADYDMRPAHKVEGLEIIEKARRWCDENASKPEGAYDMRRINKGEKKILDVVGRARSLLEKRLYTDAEQRQKHGYRRNGVLDLIQSGAKGKTAHFVQMGAMVGQQMPGRGRVVANVAHFNVTMHTPEAHGFVPECYRDGLSPWSFFCAAIGGREGLVHTGSSTPQVGYFQKRLGTNMSDLHAKPNGSICDCRDQIVQWSYGDDAKDPSHMESNEAKFFTPAAVASPELRSLQQRVFMSRAQLYDTAQFIPNKFLAPVNFANVFRRSYAYRVSRQQQQPQQQQQQPQQPDKVLTVQDVERLIPIWFQCMADENLLRLEPDPRYNLLLDAMLKDAFSPWHIVTKHAMNLAQLEFVLREVERRFAAAALSAGEAVGPIASQSMGEPATQSTLNQFHFAGSQNTQQLVVSRLNDTANACKKPNAAGMTIFVLPEWSKRRDLVEMIARDVRERRLLDFVIDTSIHLPGAAWSTEDTDWLPLSLELQPSKAQQWFQTLPCVRLEFDHQLCRRLHLHALEIGSTLYNFFKRGVAVVHAGSYSDKPVFYIVLDLSGVAYQPLSVLTSQCESAVMTCLQESCVRGLPRVTDAMVVALETRYFDPITNQIRTRSCCPAGTRHSKDCTNSSSSSSGSVSCRAEWAIVTQGSNFDGLLTLPAVDFDRCSTTYVHDVHKLLGIEGARRWLDENLEELVRRSRVDMHHTKLIADVMTRTGTVTPMTRNGLKNSTDSACRLLFENVLENIKTAGVFAQTDPLRGVPESILMGIPAQIGTGSVRVLTQDLPTTTTTTTTTSSSTATPFKVKWGIRKIPCRPRPFRFFQMFVPIGRNGNFLLSESRGLLMTPTLSSTLANNHDDRKSVAANVPLNLFSYSRIPRWSEAVPVVVPEQVLNRRKLVAQRVPGTPQDTVWDWDLSTSTTIAKPNKVWQEWIEHMLKEPREFDVWSCRSSLNDERFLTITHLTDINSSETLVTLSF